jgi:predicted DNA-binding ribbon-helix-helix protein
MQPVTLKRSVIIAGHKTSVSLEDAFWNGLKDIGRHYNKTLSDLVGDIADRRLEGNLSSAIRIFVLEEFRAHMAAFSSDCAASNTNLSKNIERTPPAHARTSP